MPGQVYLITGASTGFGRLASHHLALAGNIVFAGQYSHDGNTKPYEEELASFAVDHAVDLRPVSLDLLSDDSVRAAVDHIMASVGRIDVLVHNAGHMGFGPAESFTTQQYTFMYEINVVGAQRLNQVVLPAMRRARRGHVVWIGSSSVYGAKSPMLGPYFAAKAAMDSLAQTYAMELHPWGIETTILSPGVFAKGTNHFADAAKPGLKDVVDEYESGPSRGMAEQTMKGTVDVAGDADPIVVAEALVELDAVPRGKKPLRVEADPAGSNADVVAPLVDRNGELSYKSMGLEKFLKVWL